MKVPSVKLKYPHVSNIYVTKLKNQSPLQQKVKPFLRLMNALKQDVHVSQF